jgi:hypothetical protein
MLLKCICCKQNSEWKNSTHLKDLWGSNVTGKWWRITRGRAPVPFHSPGMINLVLCSRNFLKLVKTSALKFSFMPLEFWTKVCAFGDKWRSLSELILFVGVGHFLLTNVHLPETLSLRFHLFLRHSQSSSLDSEETHIEVPVVQRLRRESLLSLQSIFESFSLCVSRFSKSLAAKVPHLSLSSIANISSLLTRGIFSNYEGKSSSTQPTHSLSSSKIVTKI